jgi:hypothetical protein
MDHVSESQYPNGGLDSSARTRNELTLMFIGVMVAIAYEQMVSPVRRSVLIDGLSLPTCALVVTFLATTLRFFIGALLHLYDMAKDPLSWLIDFLVIFFECLIMIFMGGLFRSRPIANLILV